MARKKTEAAEAPTKSPSPIRTDVPAPSSWRKHRVAPLPGRDAQAKLPSVPLVESIHQWARAERVLDVWAAGLVAGGPILDGLVFNTPRAAPAVRWPAPSTEVRSVKVRVLRFGHDGVLYVANHNEHALLAVLPRSYPIEPEADSYTGVYHRRVVKMPDSGPEEVYFTGTARVLLDATYLDEIRRWCRVWEGVQMGGMIRFDGSDAHWEFTRSPTGDRVQVGIDGIVYQRTYGDNAYGPLTTKNAVVGS